MKSLLTLGALSLLLVVNADQPIKCQKSEVKIGSTWTFHTTPKPDSVNLYLQQEVCTHQMPNKIQLIDDDYQFHIVNAEIWKIKIVDDKSVEALKCPNLNEDCAFDSAGSQIKNVLNEEKQEQQAQSRDDPNEELVMIKSGDVIKGSWDVVFGQSFVVILESGERFVSNFQYNVKQGSDSNLQGESWNITQGSLVQQNLTNFKKDIGDHDYDRFVPNCQKTMLGFVQDTNVKDQSFENLKIQCFFGVQDEHFTPEREEPKKEIQNKTQSTAQVETSDKQLESVAISNDKGSVVSQKVQSSTFDVPQDSEVLDNEEAKGSAASLGFSQIDESVTALGFTQIQDSVQAIVENRPNPRHVSKMELAKHHHLHEPSPESDVFIQWVNNNPHITWTANTCMLSKSHPDYDQNECEPENSMIQLSDESKTEGDYKDPSTKPLLQEINGVGTLEFGKGKNFQATVEKTTQLRTKYKTAEEIPDSQIPKNFDLSNIDGYDFTGKVRDQGSCGSCYTVSFVQALESRLKYTTGKDSGPLSAQHMLQCNYMTEGCQGGWAILDGYLAEAGGVMSEQCAPYLAHTKGKECGDYSMCQPVAKVSKSYSYDNPQEMQIKKEILRNGMLVTDWYMPPYSKTYKAGIFQNQELAEVVNKMQQAIPNHASNIIGWGEQGNTKYWIIRNSFGESFGVKGNIYVKMGQFMVNSYVAGFDVNHVESK